jgi:hypothetical protein
MSLDNSTPARIREFRHLFAGHRRIVATVRIDLAHVRFRPGAIACFRCKWDGSKERQPSAELYPEFKEWIDYVLCGVVEQTGSSLLCPFDLPGDPRTVEVWFYDHGEKPRLAKTLRKRDERPLSELLARVPQEN